MKIDRNIPLPPRRMYDDTIARMRPGDSIFFKTQSEMETIRFRAKKLGHSVTSRKEGSGFRLWLTKKGE